MKTHFFLYALLALFVISLAPIDADAQRNRDRDRDAAPDEQMEKEEKSPLNAGTFTAFKLRNVGPAFASGRIADIAIHPEDDNVWYVAVGSGGVWKTTNAGTTFEPIFDGQSVYSTGCITIDPNNPHTVWLGTGENVGGRHVAFGDGVYVSHDDGKSWKNMGLKKTEHISKIIVHPANSDIVWVAAQGPLWNSGGERGLYKTTDGGETWKRTLGNDEWTGVTDLVIDSRNPDVLYAATWDRHRTVAAYMGGGPGSGLHKSIDGGETWTKLTKGLPRSNLGKIGLAISYQDPDVLYAAIETDRTTGGVWKSVDQGMSWSKQSSAVSGATGPHYYQELYTCPHNFDRLYLMDVRIQISNDGGKTFTRLPERQKHSDNHSINFRMDDPDYLLVGTDAGIYESFDGAANWRYMNNLPLTQYYKVAVDDREPFYHIFGGTQDNGSHGGPSATDDRSGIRNADWYKTLGADGHQSATEPGNPNIIYAETQQGGLHRVDLVSGETVFIQPQPGANEDFERYNWDAPILVSPHSPSRIYFASQRVWRSDNRGDSWTAISGDLTRDQERITLPIMGKQQSWDNPWDVNAMSNYNTITSLAESPLQEGLIYAGTDDGIVQVTEDGGATWRKIEVKEMGVPATSFVNDIKADLFDVNTVYVALDNHKYGDFKPYLVKSTDRGLTWTSITEGFPEACMIWRTVQDHVNSKLQFAATEFGIYFTIDNGGKWIRLKGGDPTIAFRDLTIQRRENDLVCASFGRGFFVLDDYSPLREVTEEKLKNETLLFAARDAKWFVPRNKNANENHYFAPNPEFGAVFSYYIHDEVSTMKGERKKKERELAKAGEDIPFPGWDALQAEENEEGPQVYLTIKDMDGNLVRRIEGRGSKGFHRLAWDLRYASKNPIRLGRQGGGGFGGFRRGGGLMATPGTYTATLSRQVNGEVTKLAGPVEFHVVPLRKGTLEGASYEEIIAFREDLEELQEDMAVATYMFENSMEKVEAMNTALERTDIESTDLVSRIYEVKQALIALDLEVNGYDVKDEIGENNPPSVRGRMFTGMRGLSTTYGPTPMHKEQLAIAKSELQQLMPRVRKIAEEDIPALERALDQVGAPWIEGTPPKNK
ncbi:MAG: glycosyl hydrolase [Saprospiraceae bacterium]|nr:glycosyl hydrolase [Saprospiraceae bacterium]